MRNVIVEGGVLHSESIVRADQGVSLCIEPLNGATADLALVPAAVTAAVYEERDRRIAAL